MSRRIPSTLREWWFGAVPEDWRAVPLKHLCDRSSLYGANIPAEMYESDGVRFLRTTDISEDGTLGADGVFVPRELVAESILAEGDFLISRSGTVGRAFVYRETDGPCSYAGYLVRYVLNDKRSARWLFYVTKSAPFAVWLGASAIEATIGNVNGEKYANLVLPVPPLEFQRAISGFLDRETARIDALLAAKQRLLDLLAEKRKAIIATAVTRGLDPKVKLRDSGVPWLGEIPAHWQLLKFAWCVTIAEGQVDPEDDEFSAWPLIAPNHVESGTGRLLGLESAADQGAISGKYECRPGDVIYSKIRPALRKATIAPKACLCSADMYPMRVVRERLTPEYLLHYLLTDAFSVWAVLESNRVAMPKINRESFIELRMPVPALDEQRVIVEHIARETAKLDAARAATERTIALLKERRSALIAAAVTGQLDVTMKDGAAA